MQQTPEQAIEQPAAARITGHWLIAWLVILAGVAGAIALRQVNHGEPRAKAPSHAATTSPVGVEPPPEDPLGVLLMNLQAKYMIGANAAEKADAGQGGIIYAAAKPALNMGTVPQRQRFVVLASELVGPAEAGRQLAELDGLIAKEQGSGASAGSGGSSILRPEEAQVQNILHKLYDGAASDAEVHEQIDRAEQLSAAERETLSNQMEWIGRLSTLPRQTPHAAERDQLLAPAVRLVEFLSIAITVLIAVGIAGFVGLVVVLVLMFTGQMQPRMGSGRAPHAIYAETFAIWLPAFFLLQLFAGKLGALAPDYELLFVLTGFFGSLFVLAWPVARGIGWRDVRKDIGWTLGPTPLVEPAFGVMGYAMALPILGVGVAITFAALLLQKAMSGTPDVFGPTAGPAHPIILQLAGPDLWPKIQVIVLGAIAAPIVEETMFRGVLYRHLRDASRWLGIIISVCFSGLVSAFIFAAIHPQGWVAVPALMSLALAFALMREWRGTLLPSMMIHGISNFVVLTGVSYALSA